MKRKWFIPVIFGFLGLSVCIAFGMEPVNVRMGGPESKWNDTNGTLSITSYTVTTIDAVTRGYRKVTIPNTLATATTFYYRVDGSTINIPTVGLPVVPNATAEIETEEEINLLLEPGMPGITVRYLERRK
jgi:hypothetical protein